MFSEEGRAQPYRCLQCFGVFWNLMEDEEQVVRPTRVGQRKAAATVQVNFHMNSDVALKYPETHIHYHRFLGVGRHTVQVVSCSWVKFINSKY